jgi:hypothetical protein
MPTGRDILAYLTWLEKEYSESSFVLVPADSVAEFPWLRKYAWLSDSYVNDSSSGTKAEPKEMPVTGDRLFIVGRNLSFGRSDVLFECESERAVIRLDHAEADGVFRRRLILVPGGAPVDDTTPITIMKDDSISDLLHVRTSLASGDEAHNKTLLIRF